MSGRRCSLQCGVTMIELMVAIVIASLVGIAVASVLAGFEGRRRTSSEIDELNQTGSRVAWELDGQLRSAGTGFAQTAEFSFGCKLLAAKNGTTILPAAQTIPAPFESSRIGRSFRLAPVLIVRNGTVPTESGNGSDVLVVMSGAAGKAVYMDVTPAAASLTLKNTLGYAASDLILLADPQVSSTSGVMPCMLSQVSGSFKQQGATALPLAGRYFRNTIDSRSLTSYSSDTVALNLGNIGAANSPSFNVIGVGDNGTLYIYDLLQIDSIPLKSIANDIFELHALYGVDTNGDGKVDTWCAPTDSYSYDELSTGSLAAARVIARIRAIRVGLILRTALQEKTDVSPTAPSLFSDLGPSLTYSPRLKGGNTKYRYRTVEFTVPLRNAILLE